MEEVVNLEVVNLEVINPEVVNSIGVGMVELRLLIVVDGANNSNSHHNQVPGLLI